MDKNVLKKFAIESRKELMDKIRNKVNSFYVDENFKSEQKGDIYILSNENHSLSLTNDEFKKRELLIKRINDLSREQVVEEAAYTWFNRIIAIRYMEINDMLPLTRDNQSLGIRVLSSKDNTPDPEILKFSNLVNSELDIDLKKEKYVELKDDNEKFKYVLLLVCKKMGKVIPQVFDGTTDYIDLLIPDNLLKDAGFVAKVINEVPESNFNQVEIIGWLYQYYNQLEKDKVISKKKIAYRKNEIPYATQLFTPDWIVKYMVENTLGRYIVENFDFTLKDNFKYLIKRNIKSHKPTKSITDITFLDPCCGSGHILVYAFDVLYNAYVRLGFNKNDITEKILLNNLYGLDIDDRAGQLSILSLILKAREYDKFLFGKDVIKKINVYSIYESNNIEEYAYENKSEDTKNKIKSLIHQYKDGKELGSLIIPENNDYSNVLSEIENDNSIFGYILKEKIINLIKVDRVMQKKYDFVVTNPPYMNNSTMSVTLKNYINKNYKDERTDLFSCFISRNIQYCNDNGYLGFMTPSVWMFISTFEELRRKLIYSSSIETFIQLEYSALEEATVPICAFTLKKQKEIAEKGLFIKLSDFSGGMKVQEEKYLDGINNMKQYVYECNIKDVAVIDGQPLSYWLTEKMCDTYKKSEKISKQYITRAGMITGDNNKFLRMWYEIENNKFNNKCHSREEAINSNAKWFPYSKGGEYRKWYGNCEYVVNWENDGEFMRNYKDSSGKIPAHAFNLDYIFKTNITWSSISSSKFSARLIDYGFLYDAAGSFINVNAQFKYYMLGLLCSVITQKYLEAINPTLNFQKGNIGSLPFRYENSDMIEVLVKKNVEIEKEDWDSFETSWNFTRHPLLKPMSKVTTIKDSMANWNTYTYQQRSELKHNEEELNKLFIDIYGLNDELTPTVDDKDITIRKEDKIRDIKSFISYAVGCMFGRYSLDKDGLIYAGGDFDNVYQKYKKADGGWAGSSLSNYKYLNYNGNEIELSFEVDNDNIIPITDEAYFSDDIVERFKTFIKTVYGDNTFNENMDFIAETLGKKGTETSEETIRRYFVNDFFNDHVKMYQKRPIYWLLDSGKKNGFKALVYMHRYNENLIPKARLDYLHRVQTTYEKLLSDVNYKLTTDLSMIDKKETKNRQVDLNAKLNEIKEYDEKIAHIANQRISIDLDDGVKVNYEKFKDILAKIK